MKRGVAHGDKVTGGVTKVKLSKSIVQFSFQNAAESCVRLVSFGRQTGDFSTPDGAYFEKIAEELVHSDLVACAISLRRIAEITEFNKFARKYVIQKVGPQQMSPSKWKMRKLGQTIPLWEFINVLLHCDTFEVIADDFKIKVLGRMWKENALELLPDARFSNKFKPAVLIGSKHVPLLIFEILDFAETSMKFLDAVAEMLSDNGIYIGNANIDA